MSKTLTETDLKEAIVSSEIEILLKAKTQQSEETAPSQHVFNAGDYIDNDQQLNMTASKILVAHGYLKWLILSATL